MRYLRLEEGILNLKSPIHNKGVENTNRGENTGEITPG